jgi:hypothetical protein
MKIAVLPALQDERNKKINKGLKALGVLIGVALFANVASVLYIYGHHGTASSSAEVRSSDGTTVLGPAIPTGADFVLCNCKSPATVSILSPSGSLSGKTTKSETIASTDFSLIRLESPLPQPVTLGNLEDGAVGRVSEGDHDWTGALNATDQGLFTTDHEIQCEPGTPVYSSSDPNSVLGVVIQSGGKQFVIPMRDVVQHFSELR